MPQAFAGTCGAHSRPPTIQPRTHLPRPASHGVRSSGVPAVGIPAYISPGGEKHSKDLWFATLAPADAAVTPADAQPLAAAAAAPASQHPATSGSNGPAGASLSPACAFGMTAGPGGAMQTISLPVPPNLADPLRVFKDVRMVGWPGACGGQLYGGQLYGGPAVLCLVGRGRAAVPVAQPSAHPPTRPWHLCISPSPYPSAGPPAGRGQLWPLLQGPVEGCRGGGQGARRLGRRCCQQQAAANPQAGVPAALPPTCAPTCAPTAPAHSCLTHPHAEGHGLLCAAHRQPQLCVG